MDSAEPSKPPAILEHIEGVRRLARALAHDVEEAEDVAQEAVLAAITRPPRPGWSLRAWLAGVVKNKAR